MPKKSTAQVPRKLSPSERHNLDVEISFLEGLVRRDPKYVEALQLLGDDYTRRGRFGDGLKVDEELVRMRPDDSTALYNLACSYSLTGQFEAALEALNRALDIGYRDFKHLRRDPDLKPLRQQPGYRKIRARIRALMSQP